jgi:hypothetical protein
MPAASAPGGVDVSTLPINPNITVTATRQSAGSWLVGAVVSAPSCPGPVVGGQDCPPRPASGAEVDITGGTRPMSPIVLAADVAGRFKVQLAPGTYTVKAVNVVSHRSTTSQLVVINVGVTTVILTLDSGIR